MPFLQPPGSDLEDWEDVSEVSFRVLENSRVVVVGDNDFAGQADPAASFPAINIGGDDEWHRLRLHARGRDKETGEFVEDAPEEYLFVAWPSPEAAPLVFKVTSKLGEYDVEVDSPVDGVEF